MNRGATTPARALCLVAVIVALLLAVAPVGAREENAPPTRKAGWIVGLRSAPTGRMDVPRVLRAAGDAELTPIDDDQDPAFLLEFDGTTRATDAVAGLLAEPDVAYVEPDIWLTYDYLPNDALLADQQWKDVVAFPDAWSVATGSGSTVVAVLDSGVRSDHPDLAGKVLDGYDFFDDDSDPTDTVGHGTAIAAIIAARGDDATGIAGGAMDVSIMPVRVGNGNGAPVSAISRAMYYAVDHGASVINLSLGTETPSATLESAINDAYDRNVAVVASAGNKPDSASFPASYQRTISVGAATAGGEDVAPFSSRISRVDVAAPGVDVLTAYWTPSAGNTWAYLTGSSFAAPIVSGAVALMRSVNPDLPVEAVRTALVSTARPSFQSGGQGGGAGLLDASRAVRQALLPSFAETWARLDDPVAGGLAVRTWLWGPNAFQTAAESFAEAQHGERLVTYFDKGRMEITDPYGDRTNPWYVTSGLLVTEMVSGRVQNGFAAFEQRAPADVHVAGDPDDATGPVYAAFRNVAGAAPLPEGATITQTIDRAGNVADDGRFASYGVYATGYVPETNHRIANVFNDYLYSSGLVLVDGEYRQEALLSPPFYVTGYPITEPYWSRAKVAGVEQDVLVQCFERRCLTYTPANADGWKVEMGNVGQHYYEWRFGARPGGPAVDDPVAMALRP